MAFRLKRFIDAADRVVHKWEIDYTDPEWLKAEFELLECEIIVRRIISSFDFIPVERESSCGPVFYWRDLRDQALRVKGVCENYEEMERALAPSDPVASAGYLHEWIWGAAEQLWLASAYQESVSAAARSVNARIQQKSGRRDISESDLVMQVFDIKPPEVGKPRLWMPGDRDDPTWRSLQEGVKFYGVGCFKAIRNPAAHKESTNWGEQEAMEYLSSFSVFARWVSEADLRSIS